MQEKTNILNELKQAGAVNLLKSDKKNHYAVPENYFNEFAGSVLSTVFVHSLPKTVPYQVPAGYFENLPGIVLDKLSIHRLHTTEAKNAYSVPEGYFNALANNILIKIKNTENSVQKELEELSPLLSKISKENVYFVPENYFNELDAVAVNKKFAEPAKVISIGSKTRKWLNYAVAACLAAVLFGTGYLYFTGNENSSVASAPKINVQKAITGLSDDEITKYLDKNSNVSVFTDSDVVKDEQQSIDIHNMLQNVSDEEIHQYLQNDPESAERGDGIKM